MPQMNFNYYAFLGLPNKSDVSLVKKEINNIRLFVHPDKCNLWIETEEQKEQCIAIFEALKNIETTMLNPFNKKVYDNTFPAEEDRDLIQILRDLRDFKNKKQSQKKATSDDADSIYAQQQLEDLVKQLQEEKAALIAENAALKSVSDELALEKERTKAAEDSKKILELNLQSMKEQFSSYLEEKYISSQLRSLTSEMETTINRLRNELLILQQRLNLEKKTVKGKTLKVGRCFEGEHIPKINKVYQLIENININSQSFQKICLCFASESEAKEYIDEFNLIKDKLIEEYNLAHPDGDEFRDPPDLFLTLRLGQDSANKSVVTLSDRGFINNFSHQLYHSKYKTVEGFYRLAIYSLLLNLNNVPRVPIDATAFHYQGIINVLKSDEISIDLKTEYTIEDVIIRIEKFLDKKKLQEYQRLYIIDETKELMPDIAVEDDSSSLLMNALNKIQEQEQQIATLILQLKDAENTKLKTLTNADQVISDLKLNLAQLTEDSEKKDAMHKVEMQKVMVFRDSLLAMISSFTVSVVDNDNQDVNKSQGKNTQYASFF